MSDRISVAILGAGMAGLSAAHHLKDHADVRLFDKSRGVGGRMSTRYAGEYEFDHGAQYFTAQDPHFLAAVEAAIEAGVVQPWPSRAFYLKSGELTADTGRARFVGAPRMNSWPKYLAQDLDITLGKRVSEMTRDGADTWRLDFEDGEAASGFGAVICTAPPAQAELLLPTKFAPMPAVKAAKLDACFALMIGLEAPVDLGWDTLRVGDLPVAWMAMNHVKPGRGNAVSTLVIHADAAWSETHQDADREWVQSVMLNIASALCGLPLSQAPHIALHRWLYASPGATGAAPDQACLYDPALQIAAAGDWCAGGRVQGAWVSGKAAAEAILAGRS